MDYLEWTDRVSAIDREAKAQTDALEVEMLRIASWATHDLGAVRTLRKREDSDGKALSGLGASVFVLGIAHKQALAAIERLKELALERASLMAMDTSNLPGPVAEEGEDHVTA